VTLKAIRNSEGESQGFAGVARDATALKATMESQLMQISQLEDRDAARTRQLDETEEELRRRNREIANYLNVITAQQQEKEVILREVYHRVKNNLQVVESLLKMKSRSLADPAARLAIETSMQRIRMMGMIHEHLYQTPDLGGVSLAGYLRDLIGWVIAVHALKPDDVDFEVDVEEIPIVLDVAIPFGLLINELLSNCLRHGLLKGGSGKIYVSVRRSAKGVRMAIKDNGIGLPEGFDLTGSGSIGLKLAAGYARQLGGSLECTSSQGCHVQAEFTGLAGQAKAECLDVGKRMAGTHPFLPPPIPC
jgi:two-component sensor histidine kinase